MLWIRANRVRKLIVGNLLGHIAAVKKKKKKKKPYKRR